MDIPKNLKDEIWEYCRLNDIPNIDEFIIKMIRQGYTVEKFGSTPVGNTETKEIEKIVEVPVEKIIEKIVEVPVEKIIEKEVYITDDEQVKILTEKISELYGTIELERQNFSTKTTEMENNFQKEKDDTSKEYNLKISDLNTKILQLETEIEKLTEEIEKENKKNKTDIYGEDKRGGWFGSNIMRK
jgi:hypothetical protein